MNINQAVVFAILMQSGRGIIGKHPDYLAEKLEAVAMMARPEGLLDEDNLALYHAWLKKWDVEGGTL